MDGAIHRAGGPEILAECRLLGGCDTGEAKATTAGWLPARYVIHTVGPIWRGGGNGEAELLAACYRRSIVVADELGCRTVTFPAISTGSFGYPLDLAAEVAVDATTEALAEREDVEQVTSCSSRFGRTTRLPPRSQHSSRPDTWPTGEARACKGRRRRFDSARCLETDGRASGPQSLKRSSSQVWSSAYPVSITVRWPSAAVRRASTPGMCAASHSPCENGTNLSCSPWR